MDPKPNDVLIDELIKRKLDEILPQKIEEALAARREKTPGSMAIIASRGTLDGGYPPFILATTAAALGWNVSVFFTFYGLGLLKKDIGDLRVSALGNPSMPMKMPFGPEWFKDINWNVPNAVQAVVPGFEALATTLMKQTVHNKGVASIPELRSIAVESGVELIACQMTLDLFGYKREEFIPEVRDFVGAASFLAIARDADVTLFI